MFEWTGKKKEWTENIETVIVIIVFSMSKKVRGDKEIQKKKNTQIESLEIKNDTWDEKVHRMAVKENCCCHLHYTATFSCVDTSDHYMWLGFSPHHQAVL